MQLNLPLKIIGLGRYLPPRIVPNSELETICALPSGWIERRNGVRERRWATTETASFMAAEAAREALDEAKLRPDQLSLIINASGTPEQAIPDTGALIQRQLGLGKSGIPAMSVHTTCLSFITALDVAATYINAGRYNHILIASSEISSCGINPKEPESATLVGDAAAAVVVTRATEGDSSSLHHAHFKTWGEGAAFTSIRGGGSARHPAKPGHNPDDDLFHMDGPAVLRMVRGLDELFLEELYPGLSKSLTDIDLVVPHQSSKVGLLLLQRYGWPEAKIMRTLHQLGNCVAASIPATLYQSVRDGNLQRGQKLLLVGTGAGLSIGGVVMTY
ncbi:3-oxoacyl-[acyl-carrier-protein] synthase III C-terminal domain-containing protein [Pelodictyon phaeoclathratiforme]|jgi:3-oxoacyl-[acyl-carrier-protein] synthase-3|uniref:Beta-ketoacyl-acyl-carrier-protein synthase I n=1 Tax=Pelodictyon phaeoclathratiforme (strain DSM 5477 / BU-1) TaxID=324925 RepID=B4SF12_PELPB|nr:3-oxoacyl-[acyl-carrier-protein] synthase III C-terminal domain-containing protein [Pelodictyon phaeoclathratiforme]ACF43159.1 Beta-ketoacyl-acyl-carrier-protein synthase I [Pelodictyon phaeoclathratiforme BU-1]MBV5290600.1 ketoacyl-ACP synthase III [Pelodictyon phaeoclathratiforme]